MIYFVVQRGELLFFYVRVSGLILSSKLTGRVNGVVNTTGIRGRASQVFSLF